MLAKESDDVFPSFATNDAANHAMNDTELLRKLFLSVAPRHVQSSDFSHVVFRQLVNRYPLTSRQSFWVQVRRVLVTTLQALGMGNRSIAVARCLSTLRVAVCMVIGVRSQPEMMGIAADRVIAGVADKRVVGNRAVGQHVGETMGTPLLAVQLECAITRIKNRAGEGPALSNGATLNFREEMSRGIMEGHSNHPQTMIGVPSPRTLAASRGFDLLNYTRTDRPLHAAVG